MYCARCFGCIFACFLATGCSSSTAPPAADAADGSVDAAADAPRKCEVVTLGVMACSLIVGESLTCSAKVTSPLGVPSEPDELELEIRRYPPGAVGKIKDVLDKTGVFDLAGEWAREYRTCQHCLILRVDKRPDLYFQAAGTLTIDSGTPPSAFETKGFHGKLSAVELVESDYSDGVLLPLAGGKCVRIDEFAF